MASGSKCRTTGMSKKDCPCFNCMTKRNNASLRGGSNRSNRRDTASRHGDPLKGNRGNGGGKKRR